MMVMVETFVVIGGDAAGMSAASKAKRDAPDIDVIVFERSEWVAYGACGLPYYIKGDIETLDDLVSVTPMEFINERDIDLRLEHEVTTIDPEARTVTSVGPTGERFEQAYDTLLIATGAHAVLPDIPGTYLDGVFTLHSITAGQDIREYVTRARSDHSPGFHDGSATAAQTFLDTRPPERVALVGGGYIGIELAEAFVANDMTVELFQRGSHLLSDFGEAVAGEVEAHLREQSVGVHLDAEVTELIGDDGTVAAVRTATTEVDVDMVVVGAGVRPNVELAVDAGIELGSTGAISTDEYGRTSIPNVFAAGDCAEVDGVVSGEPIYVPLALTANRHGRAIGQTVTGDPTVVGPAAGTAAVKAFDLEAATTGVIDHDTARELGFDPVTNTIEADSRAGYYPGGSPITISLTADHKTGRLLGASMVGMEGVVHRINALVTALHAEMTVADIEYLDLAYAPPFSPTWDPILVAAKVLNGQFDGEPVVETDSEKRFGSSPTE
jgi:NADPH-dependent 2,4-dienoyl-CoA reductase/sulfur reductase-like enzyme